MVLIANHSVLASAIDTEVSSYIVDVEDCSAVALGIFVAVCDGKSDSTLVRSADSMFDSVEDSSRVVYVLDVSKLVVTMEANEVGAGAEVVAGSDTLPASEDSSGLALGTIVRLTSFVVDVKSVAVSTAVTDSPSVMIVDTERTEVVVNSSVEELMRIIELVADSGVEETSIAELGAVGTIVVSSVAVAASVEEVTGMVDIAAADTRVEDVASSNTERWRTVVVVVRAEDASGIIRGRCGEDR